MILIDARIYSMLADQKLLAVEKLTKAFGNTVAVSEASFSVSPQEIVALAGGNGSGKSTLMKMIAGALIPDAGRVEFDGISLKPGNTHLARERGIAMVYQDCALCPDASVLENLFLGREPVSNLGFLKIGQMRQKVIELLEQYDLPIVNLDAQTGQLSGGQQKAIAIGRALLSHPRLLMLDEPTAALGVKEQKIICEMIKDLKSKGVSIILCTHSPSEILMLADRVIVLRRGELVRNQSAKEITETDLAVLMST